MRYYMLIIECLCPDGIFLSTLGEISGARIGRNQIKSASESFLTNSENKVRNPSHGRTTIGHVCTSFF